MQGPGRYGGGGGGDVEGHGGGAQYRTEELVLQPIVNWKLKCDAAFASVPWKCEDQIAEVERASGIKVVEAETRFGPNAFLSFDPIYVKQPSGWVMEKFELPAGQSELRWRRTD
jgi:hypothetical protein